jgi:hypothetical protein
MVVEEEFYDPDEREAKAGIPGGARTPRSAGMNQVSLAAGRSYLPAPAAAALGCNELILRRR